MVKRHRNIFRILLLLGYLGLILSIVFGVSKIISYLNTGADRSKMLHTEIQKVDQYLPKIVWKPLQNKGREVSQLVLNELENDYLDAWYVRNLAYQTNTKKGIEDYFTESARENLYQFIDENKKQKITIESTTLEHHPKVEFFSEDGQLIVITDEQVLSYTRVFKDGKIIFENNERATYKIIFLLEDGFWRIRHFVQTGVAEFEDHTTFTPLASQELRGINYYPQKNPWKMFSDDFDIQIIENDFKIIKEAHLNTIRIFIPYTDFGEAQLKEAKLDKLLQVLDAAEKYQLKVMLTLFDFYGDYAVVNWTLNQRHAEKIVTQFKNHPAVLAWDLKNEPNLDFESRGAVQVQSWLKSMIYLVKSIDTIHPVTIGWSNTNSASILKDKIDFVSFHYYEDLNDLATAYAAIKKDNPNKLVVLSEFGISSYSGFWNLFSGSQEAQLAYHQKAQAIFKAQKVPFYNWTLYDFEQIPKEVVGQLPWRVNPQKEFGFIDAKGTKKASFSAISK